MKLKFYCQKCNKKFDRNVIEPKTQTSNHICSILCMMKKLKWQCVWIIILQELKIMILLWKVEEN